MHEFFLVAICKIREHIEGKDSSNLSMQVDRTRRVVSTNPYKHLFNTNENLQTLDQW
mgnify:CR=1 FL=1